MMRKAATFLLLFVAMAVLGQDKVKPMPVYEYRSADNPEYWKNRKPYDGYWQQDVHYTIKVNIDEVAETISGTETLVYWNNSPEDLDYVFFHLYQEAFQPGSYYDDLQNANDVFPIYGKYELDGLGTEIASIKVNGSDVEIEQDNTILKVWLPKPLMSGESMTFEIDFTTYFGPFDGDRSGPHVRRRMKSFNDSLTKHFDGVHWYPRISVYDAKFGWTTDQHLGHEYYGDFGTWDVELTFSSNYVVDATGWLTNKEEVMPAELRQKLDISNFAAEDYTPVVLPYDPNDRKTWVFHAENVHDFAFTADPTYRIGEVVWNGVSCIALAQESNAWGWQNAAAYTAEIIKTYSETFGMYVYPKMIVADARDGMEYPMLTLDGGFDPGYRGLLCHEVAHNWFFGMLGSNESYRAAMDEGFTSFATDWCLECIDGDTIVSWPPKSEYVKRFLEPRIVKDRAYDAYLGDAIRGQDPTLNTHSDDFSGALAHGGGYRHVYFKTETMLWNLEYVLGEELFWEAMAHYFEKWKICHPYWEDFKESIVEYTQADLNWFFDQWFETSKSIDYSVKNVRKGAGADEFIVTFERIGEMQMPIDFMVISKAGDTSYYHIPNSWFEKKTDATILPRWIGWGSKLNTEYEAVITVPNKIKDIRIDPSGAMADVNMLNNSLSFPVVVEFDHRIYNGVDRMNYEAYVSPALWWNGYDGFKVGVHTHGSYMNYLHQYNLDLWLNTGLAQYLRPAGANDTLGNVDNEFDNLSFQFTYKTPVFSFSKHTNMFVEARHLDGLQLYSGGFEKFSDDKHTRAYAYFKSMFRKDTNDLTYLSFRDEWNIDSWNNTINLGVDHSYSYVRGTGDLNFHVRSSSLGSDYNYSQLSLEAINKINYSGLEFRTRMFAQWGTGSNVAPESALYLAGANPETMMDNKYTRSVGFMPYDWYDFGDNTNHFQYGGGLNLRGYAGYWVPNDFIQGNDTITRFAYKGNTGASVNIEMDFDKLIPFKLRKLSSVFHLDLYLFGDAGIMAISTTNEDLTFADIRADAGVGAALTIKKWGPLQVVKPLTIRFDAPMFLNRTPFIDPDYISPNRFVISINRAF